MPCRDLDGIWAIFDLKLSSRSSRSDTTVSWTEEDSSWRRSSILSLGSAMVEAALSEPEGEENGRVNLRIIIGFMIRHLAQRNVLSRRSNCNWDQALFSRQLGKQCGERSFCSPRLPIWTRVRQTTTTGGSDTSTSAPPRPFIFMLHFGIHPSNCSQGHEIS